MVEEPNYLDPKAPFNMAIATLLSLRNTLDKIRDVELQLEIPPPERQRIKIELVKRFYVDSVALIKNETEINKYKYILDIKSEEIIAVNRNNQKKRRKIIYSLELNKKLDTALLNLQLVLGIKGFYMPPREDLGRAGLKMS